MSLIHRFAREDAEAISAASFDEFWRLYPRKVAKLEAVKAWKQMTRDYQPSEIVAGLKVNLAAMQRKEKQFVKHPASWLRAGCWMDEPETHQPRGIMGAANQLIGEHYGSTSHAGSELAFERIPAGPRH